MRDQLAGELAISLLQRINETQRTGFSESPVRLVREVSSCLAEYVSKARTQSLDAANDWLNGNPRHISVLKDAGLKPIEIRELAEASTIGIDDLERRVAESARRILEILLAQRDEEKGCWNFLESEIHVGNMTSNAWVTACCLYALWKAGRFLSGDLWEGNVRAAGEKAIDWLFSKNVLCNADGKIGWTSKHADQKTQDDLPKIHDSAYVLNILIRVVPELDYKFEAILKYLVNSCDQNASLWHREDTHEMDIPATCYNLRLFSNYIDRKGKRPQQWRSEDLCDTMLSIRERACFALIANQHKDGSWSSGGQVSDQVTTALAIHALRSAGFERDWLPIDRGCNWLLNRLTYLQGSWCWTEPEKESGERKRSAFTSGLVVSSLLQSTTFDKFSRAEAVVFWLLKEMEKENLSSGFEMATVLCTFADYMRAFQERGFFR